MSSGPAIVRGVAVREMDLTDVSQVLAIERLSYPTPWTRAMFLGELICEGTIALVAYDGSTVTGYLLASDQAGAWHVLNVCVHPSYRRRGIGEALMHALFAQADMLPHDGITLEVRVSNETAIRLYERLGFLSKGLRPGYYSDNGEDAIIMWRDGGPEG